MRSSLREIVRALAGEVVLSGELEAAVAALAVGKVRRGARTRSFLENYHYDVVVWCGHGGPCHAICMCVLSTCRACPACKACGFDSCREASALSAAMHMRCVGTPPRAYRQTSHSALHRAMPACVCVRCAGCMHTCRRRLSCG